MIYTAKCRVCDKELDYYAKLKDRKKTPMHCGKKMQRVMVASMVAPMFQEYRAIGIPGQPWIKTKAEHLATLKRHNKVEVGNDSSVAPPKMDRGEFEHFKREQLKEIQSDFEVLKQAEQALATP